MVPRDPLTEVVVFGREPRVGTVKRRLATGIGEEAAARLYAALLDHTLSVAAASGCAVRLSLASAPLAPMEVGVPWEIQPQGDLGVRLRAAFDDAFARGAERVLVVGSDCPEVELAHLQRGAGRLADADVVLGPAPDGGYWLVGQRAPGADLFTGIPWSTDQTFAATLAVVQQNGLRVSLLDELVDIDTAGDLALVAERDRMSPTVGRAVRRAVGEIGRDVPGISRDAGLR